MSLRQDYNELFDRHASLVSEAQAAYDKGDSAAFRAKMDEAQKLTPQLDQMEADLKAMDRTAKRYSPTGSFDGGGRQTDQLTRADLAGMNYKEIHAAHKAGRMDNILTGKEG